MRNLKFILSTAAILLAGALTAGLTAHAVVSPRTGEVQSAGVVTIPTVLGQTAEEVLFYPWSMYDSQNLYPLSKLVQFDMLGIWMPNVEQADISAIIEDMDLSTIGDLEEAAPETPLSALLVPFELAAGPISCDISQLVFSIVSNADEYNRTPAGAGEQLFLSDFPAAIAENRVPITLSFASANSSTQKAFSFLLRPGEPGELTEEERQRALEKVESDLRDTILHPYGPAYNADGSVVYGAELPSGQESGAEYAPSRRRTDMNTLLVDFMNFERSYGLVDTDILLDLHDLFNRYPSLYDILEDPGNAELDELLATLESFSGYTVQLITTQQQILTLFTLSGGNMVGVYYDIQLGCYSGIGVSQ